MKFPFRRGGLQALSGHRVSNTDGPAYTAILLLRLSQARGIERRRRTTGAVRLPLLHLASIPVGHSSSNSNEQPSKTPEGEGGTMGGGMKVSLHNGPISDVRWEETKPMKRYVWSS